MYILPPPERYDNELRKTIDVADAKMDDVLKSESEKLQKFFENFPIGIIPPKELLFVLKKRKILLPEEVSVSIDVAWGYRFITLWFRFPYDKYKSDGPEYEPAVLVFKDDKFVELQTRVHWRIVHTNVKSLLSDDKFRLYLTFSDHGHTPIPLLKQEYLDEKFFGYLEKSAVDKVVLVEKFGTIWDGMTLRWLKGRVLKISKEFASDRSKFTVVKLSDLKVILRAYPAKIKRNPMSKPWFSKPVFAMNE